jgi:hypothetical protein
MRSTRIIEGLDALIEDLLYSLGDAEDFVDRECAHFRDLIDDVAFGRKSSSEAKREIDEAFANGRKQIEELRTLASADARRAGFTHLHPSLFELTVPYTSPVAFVRIVKPLPMLDEGA